MTENMLVVNFKTYSAASGHKSRDIAEKCVEAAEEIGSKVIVSPQPQDMLRMEALEADIYSQHIDPVDPGSHTGHLLPENVKEAGATGTLINHSERRIDPDKIKEAVERARDLGLTSIVCAQNPEECERFSEFGPDYIAYEPPELIGGDTSVSEARPEVINEAVQKSSVKTLTGAGIKTREDVEKSIELGCKGVLVASGVVKAEKPGEAAKELCKGL